MKIDPIDHLSDVSLPVRHIIENEMEAVDNEHCGQRQQYYILFHITCRHIYLFRPPKCPRLWCEVHLGSPRP